MKIFINHSKEIISAIIAGIIITIISTLILDYIYQETGPDESLVSLETAHGKVSPPQLWSHHKVLEMSAEQCSKKAILTLENLGFDSVVKNGLYAYGNYIDNRAALKCVKMSQNSFIYVAVAGSDVKLVEKLRNQIAWRF